MDPAGRGPGPQYTPPSISRFIPMIFPLTRAHLTALVAYISYVVLLFIDAGLAPLPLLAFIAICLAAPVLPRLGFYLPAVRHGNRSEKSVALTFAGGPDPGFTPRLLDLLDRVGVTATFFVTGERAAQYPDLVREIIARGHTVGNHSYSHTPFLMLKGMAAIRREIAATQDLLKGLGTVPLAFRPPLGITGPRLWRCLLERGMFCVVSGRRPDGGSRRIAGMAGRLLKRTAPGDIILLKGALSRREDAELFLKEISQFVDGVRTGGFRIVPLAGLIGRETMLRAGNGTGANLAELFYNDLAPDYDHEQFATAVAMSKRKEYELFAARLSKLADGAGRVLEIGAGTGIFTIPIASRSREVVAVDISGNMLGLLEKKAAGEGLANIRTIRSDVEAGLPEGPFSLACAFAVLEYMADLPELLRRIAERLEPGGAIYFITSRRSFLRFFIQLGNAMRQGMWLKARGRGQVERMLRHAGFDRIEIDTHLFKVFNGGGMLLEVFARRACAPVAAAEARQGALLVVPSCESGPALRRVAEGAGEIGLSVLVADDIDERCGARTTEPPVEILTEKFGRKRGAAILAGAALAREKGYGAIITMDADGRYDPDDCRLLLDAARNSWPAIVIGERPSGTGMGARQGDISAFLGRLACGRVLPDSRSGFCLYPVDFLTSRRFFAGGRGFDIESLVRGAWAGLPLIAVPVSGGDLPAAAADGTLRGKLRDNLSLAVLYALLLLRALLPWPHRRIVARGAGDDPLLLFSEPRRFFRHLCREHASAAELAAAAWVGIFIGALPIIPFGLVTIAYVNHKLHLNKLAGMAASNVCVFPFIPFLCVEVGYFFRFGRFWLEFNRQTMLHELHYRLWEWLLGSLVVGPLVGLGGAFLTYLLVRSLRRGAQEACS